MNFEEHAAKPLLSEAGIATPKGIVASTVDDATQAAQALGPAVIKAQVPAGKRGKAGGVRVVSNPEQAKAAAEDILGMEISGHRVERVLVEEQAAIKQEFYAAVLNDPVSKSPLVLFSTLGGMDIEEAAVTQPDAVRRKPVDIRVGFDETDAQGLIQGLQLEGAEHPLTELLVKLYQVYHKCDAELLEINPLVVTERGELVALDCKFVLDDSAIQRQPVLAKHGTPEPMTELERRSREVGLRYIELDGNVGVLANGAGLTMTTLDVVSYHGGAPANFLEIGGDAYVKAEPALELVLANPRVKSVLVNFCGAVARTDVMMEGVIAAWEVLKPTVPVFFTVHGTGEDEAVQMLRERLAIEPFDALDDAVRAAVEAAT
ncbi:MAG: ADP-forming succinate--CoA ligase subunit beta [Acidiferrobacterales bacterium]